MRAKIKRLFSIFSPVPWVCMLGLDACGKSSVSTSLKDMALPINVKGLILKTRRPGVMYPEPANNKLQTDYDYEHYSKPNHSIIISILKLGIITMDWIIGYWFQLFWQRTQGYLVVYDRHYLLDLPIDSRRYRYGGPIWLALLARWLAPKPSLIIILDAPVDVLKIRKQERMADNLGEQRNGYLMLANSQNNSYVIDATQSLEDVINKVESLILSLLSGPD